MVIPALTRLVLLATLNVSGRGYGTALFFLRLGSR